MPFPEPGKINMDDVTLNLRPENRKYNINATGTWRPPYWNLEHDIIHEYDYESEDLDF